MIELGKYSLYRGHSLNPKWWDGNKYANRNTPSRETKSLTSCKSTE